MHARFLGAVQLTSTPSDATPDTSPTVRLSSGKPLALLAYVLASPNRTASRDQLIDLLWSDVDRESARHTLRQTLWFIRKKTAADLIGGSGELVRVELEVPNDRQRFLDLLEAGQVDAALTEYGGDFFPDFASPGAANFEHWADVERQRLRGLYLGAISKAVGSRLQQGRAREALAIARQARDRLPFSQAVGRLYIECLLAAGDHLTAKVEAEQLQQYLEREEEEPDPASRTLLRQALTPSATDTATDTPAEGQRLATELVGRETAFSLLVQAFERARQGTPTHVHVSGAAGFGKTRLLSALASRLRTQRARVVLVRAIPAERSLPYAFISNLVGALVRLRGAAAVSPDAASTIVGLQPAASSWLNAEPDRSTGDDAQRRRTLALIELVGAVAEDHAVAILIDDVHWMDQQSRLMIAALSERIEQSRLLLVTSARPVDRLSDLVPHATRLTLDALTIDDVSALIASVASLPAEPWADLLPARLHTATSGSPLLIVETLQLALERDLLQLTDSQWHCTDPAELLTMLGVGRAIQQRLGSLPSASADALLAMAIAGEPVTEDTLTALVGLEDVREATSLLESRGLAVRINDTWRPAHDEIAALVIDLATDRRRADVHRSVADWLEQRPGTEAATDNAWPLARATWHRWRAGDRSGMTRAFTRYVEHTRAARLATPAIELARDALGADATDQEIQQLLDTLPRRLRSRMPRWLPTIAAVGVLMLTGVSALFLHNRPPVVSPDIQLRARVVDEHGVATWAQGGIELARFGALESVDLAQATSPLPAALDSMAVANHLLLSEDGISDQFVGDSLAMDLVELRADGTTRTLVSKTHDQATPRLSPDGRLVAFLDRDYWASQAAEVAVLNRATSAVTRLTHSPATTVSLMWSPDGTRIALLRESRDTQTRLLCSVASDGATEHCSPIGGAVIPTTILAWRSDDQLLLDGLSRTTDRTVLLAARPGDSTIRVIDEGGANYHADPLGAVVFCECRVNGIDRPIAAAFLPDQPARKVPVRLHGQPLRSIDDRLVRWTVVRQPAMRIAIEPLDSIVIGETAALSMRAFGADGREVPARARRWRSGDTSVAIVDSTGHAIGRRAGTALIVVEAGAQLTDTLHLRVVTPLVHTVLTERWHDVLDSAWYPFGSPRPYITNGRLRVNGDERLFSGVISQRAFDASHGFGFQVRFRLPITASTWQRLALSIGTTGTNMPLRAAEADRANDTTLPAWINSFNLLCLMQLPRQEGWAFRDVVGLFARGDAVSRLREAPMFGDGREHTMQVQLLNDGRCAFALDGALIALSAAAPPPTTPVRLMINGQSVATTVEVLSVDAWQGVQPNGPWAVVGRR